MRLTRLVVIPIIVIATACGIATAGERAADATATATATLFDPQRHMRVSEVRPGMKGYGLSVFQGTRIERFEVEVVSVLRNFNPKHDVILIRCQGANLEHSGAIAGMSGSPIYLFDDAGGARMVGAFAYGWPLMKDPLAGVQPIEYMLRLPDRAEDDAKPPVASPGSGGRGKPAVIGADAAKRSAGPVRWSLLDAMPLVERAGSGGEALRNFPTTGLDSLEPNPHFFAKFSNDARLQPLASPLMVGGIPTSVLDAYSPLLRAYGLTPLQAGGAGGGSPHRDDADAPSAKLEPGSVLAVPLVTGDLDLTAVGTVTEVIDGRVFGFGHPFNNEGPVSLPMGTGQVHAVLARLDQSVKLGSLLDVTGALTTDQTVGVAGKIGEAPVTAPVELRITYADGSIDETYRFDCAIHPRFTPLLGGMAMAAALGGKRDLPRHHTLEYDLNLEFTNGQTIEVRDVAVNPGAGWPMRAIVLPLMAATENPFERVAVAKITGNIKVLAEAREAEILSVNVPRLKYKPGETLKAFITYRPFRAPESVLPIELKLPHDLRDGTYQLVVSGWQRYMRDEAEAQPFRFSAENAQQMFAVLRDVMSIRHDAVYLRLLRHPDGVAVGRVAMPRLPSSVRQVLLGSGRSDTTPFVSSAVKTIPTEFVLEGEADFSIEIDVEERVETAGTAKPPQQKPEAHTTPTAPPAAPEVKSSADDDHDPAEGEEPAPDKPDRDPPNDDLPGAPDAPGE